MGEETELERVKQERAVMLNRAYRIPPNDDTDGHSGETWREFAADTDMARIEAESERDEQRVLIDALANRECAGAYLCVGRDVPHKAFSPCEPCAARRLQSGESVSDAESFRGGATPRPALSADVTAEVGDAR